MQTKADVKNAKTVVNIDKEINQVEEVIFPFIEIINDVKNIEKKVKPADIGAMIK